MLKHFILQVSDIKKLEKSSPSIYRDVHGLRDYKIVYLVLSKFWIWLQKFTQIWNSLFVKTCNEQVNLPWC